ncbi:MAG: helix-turn-helix transcriptional regulator [Burkholderiaceae bacterium]|nr:helix-turn-helix transcriptional regulator [Burkholderiaceae bacterium]MCD8516111.1 helix-turn-helix transcriptional regulator [Burkholderiaceae bacterium]MCD8536047.1 helix-turn-helix transcriptional regulator [Burkholderiaceae bacterium]
MNTLHQLATILRQRIAQLKLTQHGLSADAGISRQTLTKALSGRADFKVTTLIALADRLGFQVLLVPKEIAPDMTAPTEAKPRVKSVVDAAIEALNTAPPKK